MTTPQGIWPPRPARDLWRQLFIAAQVVLALMLVLTVVGDVSTLFAVWLATTSTALSGVYIALRHA